MGILEADTIKQLEIKEKIKKTVSRTRKLFETNYIAEALSKE